MICIRGCHFLTSKTIIGMIWTALLQLLVPGVSPYFPSSNSGRTISSSPFSLHFSPTPDAAGDVSMPEPASAGTGFCGQAFLFTYFKSPNPRPTVSSSTFVVFFPSTPDTATNAPIVDHAGAGTCHSSQTSPNPNFILFLNALSFNAKSNQYWSL